MEFSTMFFFCRHHLPRMWRTSMTACRRQCITLCGCADWCNARVRCVNLFGWVSKQYSLLILVKNLSEACVKIVQVYRIHFVHSVFYPWTWNDVCYSWHHHYLKMLRQFYEMKKKLQSKIEFGSFYRLVYILFLFNMLSEKFAAGWNRKWKFSWTNSISIYTFKHFLCSRCKNLNVLQWAFWWDKKCLFQIFMAL